MELKNPKLTLQNTTAGFWLVRLEHRLSDQEFIDVQFKVARTDAPVGHLDLQVWKQLHDFAGKLLDRTASL